MSRIRKGGISLLEFVTNSSEVQKDLPVSGRNLESFATWFRKAASTRLKAPSLSILAFPILDSKVVSRDIVLKHRWVVKVGRKEIDADKQAVAKKAEATNF